MEQKRLYTEMTAEEQLQWVTDFEALMQDGGGRIIDMARRRQPQWQPEDATTVRRLVGLLAAWPFAQDFAEKAQRYGDYMARATRLPVYVDKVMERLADGLTMTDKDGRTVAYVSPSAPLRRRGRPSREELAARQRGEQPQGSEPDDAEARKRRTVARMLGLNVIVSGSAPREKNNAELKADRDRRRAEYERQNPSLFGETASGNPCDGCNNVKACITCVNGDQRAVIREASVVPSAARESMETGSLQQSNATASGAQVPVPSESPAPQSGTPAVCPTMSEVYQDRIEQDRLRLSDLAWLCSEDLKKRIETVRGLRVTAESASERAKTMADMGAAAKDIEPYAQQAKEAVEGYMAIYQAVDEELATVFYRLQNDEPFREKFLRRFKGVDLVKVSHICRPYYEKLRSPELDLRIRTLIEQESPEYAAKLKAEEAKKQELQALHRYIMRKDKEASDDRVRTMTERINRVRELAGDEVANSYLPILNKTIEDNKAWRAAKGKSAGTGSADSSKATASRDQVPVPSDSPAPKERKKSNAKKPADKKKKS